MDFITKLKYNFTHGNIAIKLIYINVLIFILTSLSMAIFKDAAIVSWLNLGSFSSLLHKPWSLFTYMFAHGSFLHLGFNMLMLYAVSSFYFRYFNQSSFGVFYFIGGIIGGVLFLIYNQLSPGDYTLIGASAAIYSVFFAMVAYQPNLQVRLMFIETPVKLMYLAIGLLVLGFLIEPGNFGGNISHLGGALFGYFYMKQYEKGNDFIGQLKNPFQGIFAKKSPLKTSYKRETPPRNDYDYNEWKAANQAKVDAILDKISRSGYNSLSKKEKEILFKQGKK